MLAPLTEAEKAFAAGEIRHPSEYKATDADTSEGHEDRASGASEQPGRESNATGGSNDAAAAHGLEDKKPGWITDDAKRTAAAYGLGEDDLSDFADQSDFDRFARRMDRTLVKAGLPVNAGSPANQEPPTQGAASKQEQTADQGKTGQAGQVILDDKEWEGYDEKTRGLVAHTRELNQKFQQVEQYVQHQQQVALTNSFHDAVDRLGDKRLGTSVVNGMATPLTGDPGSLREKIWEAAGQLEAGIRATAQRAGRQPEVPPMPILVKRAYNMLFGDDVKAQAGADAKKQLLSQASKVRPSEQTRRAAPPAKPLPKDASIADRAKQIADMPHIAAKFAEMQEANS